MQIKGKKRFVMTLILFTTIINLGSIFGSMMAETVNTQSVTASAHDIVVKVKLVKIKYYRDKDAFSKGDMYVKWSVSSSDGSYSASGRIPKSGNRQVHRGQTYNWNFDVPYWLQPDDAGFRFTFQAYDQDRGKDDAFQKVTIGSGAYGEERVVRTRVLDYSDCKYTIEYYWYYP